MQAPVGESSSPVCALVIKHVLFRDLAIPVRQSAVPENGNSKYVCRERVLLL